MAKKDESSEIKTENQAMPVETQQAKHSIHRDPNQALLPGNEELPAFGGLVGEIESEIIASEKRGDKATASELRVVLNKLGEVRYHLIQGEKAASEKIKPLYEKILKLFSK